MMLYWNAMAVWDCRISTRKFELCLLDVMPNMDGFTLAEEIRDVDPDIPFFPER
jgi:CheY-like chemotaxis protein